MCKGLSMPRAEPRGQLRTEMLTKVASRLVQHTHPTGRCPVRLTGGHSSTGKAANETRRRTVRAEACLTRGSECEICTMRCRKFLVTSSCSKSLQADGKRVPDRLRTAPQTQSSNRQPPQRFYSDTPNSYSHRCAPKFSWQWRRLLRRHHSQNVGIRTDSSTLGPAV